MKTTTAAYKRIIASGDSRKFLVNINMTLKDGTSLTLTEEDIWADSFSIDTASSGKSSLDIGYAVIGQCSFQIENFDERFNSYDFFNATAVVWVKLVGDTQYYRMGFFSVDEPNHVGVLISLKLLNNMWKFDDKNLSEVGLSFPCSCQTAITTVCAYCGVTLATSQFHGYQFTLTKAPEKDMNCRKFIQYVAMIGCNFCIIDDTGALRLKWYDVDAWVDDLDGGTFDTHTTPYSDGDTADGGNFLVYEETKDYDGGSFLENTTVAYFTRIFGTPQIGTDEITVTGVKIEIDETTYMVGTEGYVIDLKENPLLTPSNVNAALNLIWDVLRGFRFRTFDITTLPDLAVEVGDCCAIRDAHGNYVHSYITNNSFRFSDHQASLGAITPMRSLVKRYSETVQAAVEIARKKTDEAISNYDVAVQLMNSLAINAMGAYQDYEDIPTGGRIYYLSNMPITKENGACHFTPGSTVFMISGSGFFVSTQGGLPDTWDNGYDPETGALLVNILKAIGLEAEWIVTGRLTVGGRAANAPEIIVKDNTQDENEIVIIDDDGILIKAGRIQSALGNWFLDATTGDVRLAATATVGGKTVKQISDESSELAWRAAVQNKNYAKGTYIGVKIVNGVVTEGTGVWEILSSYVRDAYYGDKIVYLSFKIKRTGVRNTNPNVYFGLKFKVVGKKNGNTVTHNIGAILVDTITADDADFVIKHIGIDLKEQTASTMDEITAIENIHISDYESTQGTMEVKEVMISLFSAYTWVPGIDDEENILKSFITDIYNPEVLNLQDQIDRRAETYYQSTDPSINWSSETEGGITIKFNPNCNVEINTSTGTMYDYVEIYWKESGNTYSKIRKGGNFGGQSINIPAHEFWVYWHTDISAHDYYGWKIDSVDAYTGSDYTTPSATGTSLPAFTAQDKVLSQLESKHNPYDDNTDDLSHTTVKTSHKGDLWYRTTDNTTWFYDGTGWVEQDVPDEVFDKIDGKAQVFTSQPTPPYNVDDLWFQGSNGDILTCKTSKAAGQAFSSSDWEKKNKYTDDTAVRSLNEALDQDGIFDRLTDGGRVMGVYLETDPTDPSKQILLINANYIRSGKMSCNYIQGGTLELGGYNNEDGVFVIRNASGTAIVTGNKDGLTTTKLTATGDCKFGNLQIGTKTIEIDGVPRTVSYIYAEGWKQYFYREWSKITKKETNTFYFCPKRDGWTADGDVNVNFYSFEEVPFTSVANTSNANLYFKRSNVENVSGTYNLCVDVSNLSISGSTLYYTLALTTNNGSSWSTVESGSFTASGSSGSKYLDTNCSITSSNNRYYRVNIYTTNGATFDAECDYMTTDNIETIEVCRVVLRQFVTNTWSTVKTLKLKYDGTDLDEQDTYFGTFSKDDETVYQVKATLYKIVWVSEVELDIYSDQQHILEIDPHETISAFRGHLTGSASLYALSVGETQITPGGRISFSDNETDASYSIDSTGLNAQKSTNNYVKLSCDNEAEISAYYDSSKYVLISAYPRISAHYSSGNYIDIYADGSNRYVKLYVDTDKYTTFTSGGTNALTDKRNSSTTYTIPWSASDRRVKEDIEDLDVELSKNFIDATETKKFKYIDQEGKHYGMIAQDVREVLDNLGETDSHLEYCIDEEDEFNPRNIIYAEYIPHLINYVKDLRAENEKMKADMEELKEAIRQLKEGE